MEDKAHNHAEGGGGELKAHRQEVIHNHAELGSQQIINDSVCVRGGGGQTIKLWGGL